MKVIKSRLSTADWPKRCTCEECGAELECMSDDVHVGWRGVEYVTCPECNRETAISNERKAKPTWPLTFYHMCKENGAVDIAEETVQNMVDKVIESLEKSEDEYTYAMAGQGAATVFGCKHADGIDIYVTKDYWEDIIFNY